LAALTHSPPAGATNPGSNGRIVFVGVAGFLYSINPDGTGLKRLGPGWSYNSSFPHWSPDGARIVFGHWSVDPKEAGTYLMRADGSGTTKLPTGNAGSWSPDGTKITFGGGGVFVMDADGSNVTQLAGSDSRSPTWSPDGTRIAFIRDTLDGHTQVWTMDSDGQNQTLIHDDTTSLFNPDWSPDGSTIIFYRGDGSAVQIWSMHADGTSLTQLTTAGGNSYGAWSPDGTKIVFASSRGGLWLMNPDGSGQARVRNTYGEFSQPAWQPVNLLLHASSPTVTYGDSLKLTAHLLPFAESTNKTVSLYAVPVGGTETLIATGSINSSGNFSATTRPRKNTRYIAKWTGDGEHLGGGVGELVVGVHALVQGRLKGFYAQRGRYHLYHYTSRCPSDGLRCPVYKIHVAPSRAGERVVVILQLHYGGRWHQALRDTHRLNDRSSVTLRFIYGSADVIGFPTRVRASIDGNREFLAGRSRWSYFKITG
jgi:TolB protein